MKRDWALSQTLRICSCLEPLTRLSAFANLTICSRLEQALVFRECFTFAHGLVADAPSHFMNTPGLKKGTQNTSDDDAGSYEQVTKPIQPDHLLLNATDYN